MSPTHWDAKIRAKVKRRGFNSDVRWGLMSGRPVYPAKSSMCMFIIFFKNTYQTFITKTKFKRRNHYNFMPFSQKNKI